MKRQATAMGGVTAAALLVAGATVGGFSHAAAQPGDYGALPISPNVVTDSNAYTAAPLMIDPNGQQGVTAVYTHRDSSRQITNTILVLPDPAAAAAALSEMRGSLGDDVANGNAQPAPVGTGGTVVTGLSPDGTKSVSVLLFTQGNAAGSIEFEGPSNDPVPMDMVVDYGQKQDAAISDVLAS
jgi:hypothetical protein